MSGQRFEGGLLFHTERNRQEGLGHCPEGCKADAIVQRAKRRFCLAIFLAISPAHFEGITSKAERLLAPGNLPHCFSRTLSREIGARFSRDRRVVAKSGQFWNLPALQRFSFGHLLGIEVDLSISSCRAHHIHVSCFTALHCSVFYSTLTYRPRSVLQRSLPLQLPNVTTRRCLD